MRKSFLREIFYKKTLGCLTLAFLLLLPLARADTYLTDCAELNVTGETYYLTQDIINSSADVCMNITADNVTLDCQGHTIDGVDSENTYGIYVPRDSETITNITIKNCDISDWQFGIYLLYSDSNDLINITASSNGFNGGAGVYLDNSNSNNLINIISSSNSPGHGIYLDWSNSNNLINITAASNLRGIWIDNANYNNLSNIIVDSNSYCGVHLSSSNSNNLTNIIAHNSSAYSSSCGIEIDFSDSNVLSNIIANSNSYGMFFYSSNYNIINDSIIQDNEYGVYFYYTGTANLLYNNLFNNTNNFYSEGDIYPNNWNTTRQIGARIYSAGTEIGGNYWTNSTGNGYSDTCTDADKDGFCDDPYVLATDNVDYLALSDEYTPPPTTTTTTLPPVHGVPLLSSTLVGVVIGFGIITFMLRTLLDIREPKKVIEYFVVLAVIVLTVLSLIVLFA
jgi:parallel beta-helix repeat protein